MNKTKRASIVVLMLLLTVSLAGCKERIPEETNPAHYELLESFFYSNKELIQKATEILMSYDYEEDGIISIYLEKDRELSNANTDSHSCKLQEGKVIANFVNEDFERYINQVDSVEALSKLQNKEDFSEIIIVYKDNSIEIYFEVLDERIEEICKTNNGAGAEIIYYQDESKAETYGYELITDNYYSFIKPRPE